jgi:hypothetical protein
MSQRPLAVGLLLCEQVIVDDHTKRLTPVNCFSKWVIEGPLEEPQAFYAVALLTSGHGSMPAALWIERLDNGDIVFLREFKVRFEDPLEQYRLMLRLRRVEFPGAGGYQASLWMDGESIAVARFSVVQKE